MKKPNPTNLPPDLNPHAIDLWFEACQSLPSDSEDAWRKAIGKFVDLCRKDGLPPFLKIGNHDTAIRNFLYKKRKLIVQFLDYTKIMEGLKSVRIKRKITITEYGFEILVYTQVPIRDRNFVKRLFGYKTRFKLLRDRDRHYYTNLDQSTTFYVFEHYNNLYDIGYTIKCPMHPDYAGGYDKSDYILNHIWKPLYNQFRSRKEQSPIMHL